MWAKTAVPFANWLAIAYKSGYYDQMHPARDFKQFLGISPADFVPADFAF